MSEDFKGVKALEYAGSSIIEALVKIILNGEEVRLTGTVEDGQVLMRILDGSTHYWTNRTPEFPTGPDISGKVDKITGKGLSTEDFTTALKNLLNAQSNSNTGDETESTILTKLGKVSIYSQTEADNAFVAKVTGSSLITDAAKTTLLTMSTPYTITLQPGVDLATKITNSTEGVDYPTGWVLAAVDTVNLSITHGLAKRFDNLTVKSKVGTVETLLRPWNTAFADVVAETTSILKIYGIDPVNRITIIDLTFKP